MRDLHALFLMASEIHVANSIVTDAAQELGDRPLVDVCIWIEEQSRPQRAWCMTQIKENARAALVVPS